MCSVQVWPRVGDGHLVHAGRSCPRGRRARPRRPGRSGPGLHRRRLPLVAGAPPPNRHRKGDRLSSYKVAILMGSPNDTRQDAAAPPSMLEQLRSSRPTSACTSAHRVARPRSPTLASIGARAGLQSRSSRGAGMAAHLAGVVAAHTTLPVVGVPIGERRARRRRPPSTPRCRCRPASRSPRWPWTARRTRPSSWWRCRSPTRTWPSSWPTSASRSPAERDGLEP